MNETLKTILTRRSVRSFQSRKIERPDLELILKAATGCPVRYEPSDVAVYRRH